MNYRLMNDEFVKHQLTLKKLSVSGSIEERADRLCTHYEELIGATLLQCEICGGISDDTVDACPYCGDGGTQNPVPIVNEIDGPVEHLKIFDEADLNQLIDRMWREIAKKGDLRSIGLILKEIRECKLWKLRLNRNGKQKYVRYRDWLLKETPFLRASAMRLIRIAKTEDDLWRDIFPNFVMSCAIRSFTKLFPRDPEEKPKSFKPIVKIDETLGRVIEILPVDDDGKETVTLERDDGSIERARLEASSFIRRTAPRFRPLQNKGGHKVSLNLGYARLPLLRRRDNEPAQDMSEDPYLSMPLSPEIRLEIRLVRNTNGEMEAVCETKRA